MDNKGIRRKLMDAGKGCILVAEGLAYNITEVVDYKLRTAAWRDILGKRDGKEAVFELADEDVIKVWVETKELPKSVTFGQDIIVFRGESLELEESGRPRVKVNGEDEGRVSYAVYVSESDTSLCLEEWPEEGLKAYVLEKEIALSNIDIMPS